MFLALGRRSLGYAAQNEDIVVCLQWRQSLQNINQRSRCNYVQYIKPLGGKADDMKDYSCYFPHLTVTGQAMWVVHPCIGLYEGNTAC